MKDQEKDNQQSKNQEKLDTTGKGVGVSGQQPGKHEGPVAGDATNTRGENKSSSEGSGAGAKRGNYNPDSHANLSTTTRGADGSDKETRNDQPNASTQTNTGHGTKE